MQHELIIQRCKSLIDVCMPEDISFLEAIIEKSRYHLDNYNKSKRTISDPTNTELGVWKASVKKIVLGKFYNEIYKEKYLPMIDKNEEQISLCSRCLHIYNDENLFLDFCEDCSKEYDKMLDVDHKICDEMESVKSHIKDACDRTVFSENLMLDFILLGRDYNKQSTKDALEKSIRDAIKNEVIATFQEQNKELLTKYY